MYIVMVSSECAPVAKVGGLGDVVPGLARELAIRGNSVEVILPMYDCMRYDRIWGLTQVFEDLWVPHNDTWIHCSVFFGTVDDIKCYFIKPHSSENFFDRGLFYGAPDDAARFAFFSRATLEFMLKSGKHPDIIHCHDWQTGLVPVLLYEIYNGLGMTHPRVCYTLHNVHHQGQFGDQILTQVGLNPAHLMTPERLLDHSYPDAVNLMKGGIVYANFTTTVSPRYADEIRSSDLGHGLQHTLGVHHETFGGVLNGVDYNVWNPEIDPHIPHQYGPTNIEPKFDNKAALRHRLMLQDKFKPIVAVISRLDPQKGVHLIRHALFHTLANGGQFVLLGSGSDAGINDHFWELKHHLNDNPDVHLEIGYDDELAHLIYAGSDMMLVPSAFEPCGLTQLIAMKYGTVPVVRETGGLADTVFDANHAHKPYSERTGYTFHHFDNAGLESALGRALGLWYQYPRYFNQLRLNGMHKDYSWNHPGTNYMNIFNWIKN
ncbi:glycogen synthase [Magnetospira sp. QH-2]|uniref:glycogen synthase n=1 Tax=Magnetospira sp. (strain QH-2) TaxID=1288970 RepID=UPI0003E80FFA|nr:glycogen synthase [Magnetospira sp. QH-2]CCQ73907.1 GT5 : related to glycogen synthase [Magnetospira sp. QH-2]